MIFDLFVSPARAQDILLIDLDDHRICEIMTKEQIEKDSETSLISRWTHSSYEETSLTLHCCLLGL